MKLLHVLFLLVVITQETISEDNSVALFRKKTLDTLNSARRMIASGDIRKILDVFKPLLGGSSAYHKLLDYFGPATLMYKLVWNRELELASYNYLYRFNKNLNNESVGLLTLEYDKFIGFYWIGDIFAVIDKVLNFVPDKFKEQARTIYDFIEGLIMFFLIAAAAPKDGTIVRGRSYGAAELLYGERHEIGCTSNYLYAVCMVKKMEYREWFFEIGVSCFRCPHSCEYWLNDKGEYEEGDLCVPPKDFYTKQIADRQGITESVTESGALLCNCFILSVLILIYHLH